jgi:flagellar biosynthesis protein FliQ
MVAPITIQGKVVNASDDEPLAGAKVIARQAGTEIQQVTDRDGKFTLHLVPGNWHINTRAKGFNEADVFRYHFSSNTSDVELKLKEGYTISGLVINEENGKPAPGVVVRAVASINGQPERVLTDDSGRFRFTGLSPGRWEVRGTLDERRTSRETQTVGPDAYNVNLMVSRQMTSRDWNSGMVFFVMLGVLLGILAGIYIWAHNRYVPSPEPELAVLIGQVEQARVIAAEVESMEEFPEPSLQTLRSTISALQENWNNVSSSIISITEGQNEQVNVLISRAETAVTADNPQGVEIALANLQSVFANQRSIYFWSQPPNNYLEVLFWSLAGILVSLLITSGYYLRRKTFYAEGIWMHVSHILSVPLLALVVVFLISQITITVQIDESEVALDVSDPRLLAAISFTIAVLPWRILESIRNAANRIFGQVQRRIPGNSEIK